jgi:hypothetical protein
MVGCGRNWIAIEELRGDLDIKDNPLRDTVTAEGPLSLESMLEAGNLLIADPASTADATRDRSVAGLLMSEAAVRDIAAANRLEPPSGIMAIRPIKPNPRSDALRVAIRTVPRSGERSVPGSMEDRHS